MYAQLGEQVWSSTHAKPRRYIGITFQRHAPASLPPRKGSGTHCRKSSMGSRAHMNGYGEEKVCVPTGFRTPVCPARSDSMDLWGEYRFYWNKINLLHSTQEVLQ